MTQPLPETTISFDDAITSRRSVRAYSDKPLPQEALEEVFTFAPRLVR